MPVRRVAVFTGSFDPPTAFHRKAVGMLRERGFDEVILRLTGPRCDRLDGEHAAPVHRAVMADLAFRDMPGVSVDPSDLDDGSILDDYRFDDLYADRGEVWHVVSADFLTGGRSGRSLIQETWPHGAELWKNARFAVLHPPGSPPDPADLPPRYELVAVDDRHTPTADIRLRIFTGGDPGADIPEPVAAYIRRYRLFSGIPSPRETRITLDSPRLLIVADEANRRAMAAAEPFRKLESPDPNAILVIGGDGTMLAAIREHWRRRLPFLGLNAGTLGFLMNESLPHDLTRQLVVYRMPMLRVDTTGLDGSTTRGLAYGDAWVERDSGQAAWLRVDVDGQTQVPRVVGDGLLVATPSGSSAYARAMGATPVPLTAPVLTLAGSNVFRPRFWKPVALPETAVVGLTNLDETGKRPIRAFLDGHPVGRVKAMEVRVSPVAAVELAFTPQFDLSARLLRSMFPPSEEE